MCRLRRQLSKKSADRPGHVSDPSAAWMPVVLLVYPGRSNFLKTVGRGPGFDPPREPEPGSPCPSQLGIAAHLEGGCARKERGNHGPGPVAKVLPAGKGGGVWGAGGQQSSTRLSGIEKKTLRSKCTLRVSDGDRRRARATVPGGACGVRRASWGP